MAIYKNVEPLEVISYKSVNEDFDKGVKYVLEKLDALPTADVMEVKHGEWLYFEHVASHDGALSGYGCSVCSAFVNEDVFDTDEFHKKHCGCCGAIMDGEEKLLDITDHIADVGEMVQNQWISVEDDLPSQKGKYLCLWNYHLEDVKPSADVLYFDGINFPWEEARKDVRVSHWRQLPELP